METLKKVVAAIIGILIIVALILLAKWLGDQIRERIFPTKTTNETVTEVAQPNVIKPIPTRTPTKTVVSGSDKLATISATPATGPYDAIYLILGFVALAGLTSKFLANKLVI